MREEAQFLVDLQHESNKIPETNKNFDGDYIARIYGGGNFPCGLVRLDWAGAENLDAILLVSLVPGNHRGYFAEPMTEM